MRLFYAVLLAAGLAVTLLLLVSADAAEEPAGKTPQLRVAVVDVGRILTECPRARIAEERYQEQVAALRTALRDRAKEHARERSDLKLLVLGTQKYEQREQKLDEMAWRIEYDGDRGLRRIEAIRARRIRDLLTAVSAEARNLALRRGFDLVLTKTDGMLDLMKLESMDQLLGMAASRGVLYSNKRLDITDVVLEQLLK